MRYAIIGSGKIGSALARSFAQSDVEVGIANSRGIETLLSLREKLGPKVVPLSIHDACEAELIFLAVPFLAHKIVADRLRVWNGRIIIDLTNAFHATPEDLNGRLSSEVVSSSFVGAHLVKAFNHLPAEQLGVKPSSSMQRQAVFVSSNDADASATVTALATQLGFAPVELGRLDQGGVPLHVRDGRPGGLLFQNLSKLT